ncbi:MAG: hypothetical protein J0H98_09415 [Solirubrobacterales bacterium]|nr:hypothetical protein [Solirubrobacterales bacterium]
MRSHGVPDFPDPDSSGEINYGVSVSPEVFSRAAGSCKSIEPPGALDSERTPEQQSATLRFARCMRDNGVKDFPDPKNGEPLIDTTKIPSSNKPGGMTILDATTGKCTDLLEDAMGER